jgi:hypothetical protein
MPLKQNLCVFNTLPCLMYTIGHFEHVGMLVLCGDALKPARIAWRFCHLSACSSEFALVRGITWSGSTDQQPSIVQELFARKH